VKIGNKAQKGAVVIVAVGASVTISRRERIAIAVLAPVDADALFVCGALCDHGSECLLLRGHTPQDRHETQHGCVFFDPAPLEWVGSLCGIVSPVDPTTDVYAVGDREPCCLCDSPVERSCTATVRGKP